MGRKEAVSAPPAAFLTSAPFACGLAWLVNSLLAMKFRVTSLAYSDDNWEEVSAGKYRVSPRARDHLINHLPYLHDNNEIEFKPDFEAFWEHRVTFSKAPGTPSVVVVRDPRDAIFSLHRRWQANGWVDCDFVTFLDRPSEWPDHFPGLFYLNPIKTFLLFNLLWLRRSHWAPVKVVKFEDIKSRPMETLDIVLQFLSANNVQKSEMELAVESSSVSRAKSKTDQPPLENNMRAIHKGMAYEWKESYPTPALRRFETEPIRAAIGILGYETKPSKLDQSFELAVNGKSTLFDSICARLFSLAGEERLRLWIGRFESRNQRIARFLKRHFVASRWSGLCQAESAETLPLSQFFSKVIKLFITPEELEFVYLHSVPK